MKVHAGRKLITLISLLTSLIMCLNTAVIVSGAQENENETDSVDIWELLGINVMEPTEVYNMPGNPLTGVYPDGSVVAVTVYPELLVDYRSGSSQYANIYDVDKEKNEAEKSIGLYGKSGGELLLDSQKDETNSSAAASGVIMTANTTELKATPTSGKKDYVAKTFVQDKNLYLSVAPSGLIGGVNKGTPGVITIGEHIDYNELYEWEALAYLQVVAGDFDKDNVDEVAVLTATLTDGVVTPTVKIYSVSAGGGYATLKEINSIHAKNLNSRFGTTNELKNGAEKDAKKRGGRQRIRDISVGHLAVADPDNDGKESLVLTMSLNNRDVSNVYSKDMYSTLYFFKNPMSGTTPDQTIDLYFKSSAYGKTGKDDRTEVMRFASAAVGDIDGDGELELTVAGRINNSSENSKKSWDLDYNTYMVTYYKYNQETGKYENSTGGMGYFVERSKQANVTTPNIIQNPVSLVAFKYSGPYSADAIFLNGSVYVYSADPSKASLPAYATAKPPGAFVKAADCKWGFISPAEESERVWMGKAVAGNFGKSGIEQVIYVTGTAKGDGSKAKTYVNSYIHTSDGDKFGSTRLASDAARRQYYTSVCAPNVDNDSLLVRYTGRKEVFYTDPEILAILQAPPYFGELEVYGLDPEGFVTSIGTSKGHEEGSGNGWTIGGSIGGKIQGNVKVVTYDVAGGYTGSKSTMTTDSDAYELSVDFQALGKDCVVLSVIPTVTYYYDTQPAPFRLMTQDEYNRNVAEYNIKREQFGKTDISEEEKQTLKRELDYIQNDIETVNTYLAKDYDYGDYVTFDGWTQGTIQIPGVPATSIKTVDEYDRIAEKYGNFLPLRGNVKGVKGNVFNSTQGDPFSYGNDPSIFIAPDLSVFGSTSAGTKISESFTTEQTHSVDRSWSNGGFLEVSVTFGKEVVSGGFTGSIEGSDDISKTTVDSNGTTYAVEMPGFPKAEGAEYKLSWNYGYWTGGIEGQSTYFPIVGFSVTNITAPAVSPPEIAWTDGVNPNSVVLKWTPGTRPAERYIIYKEVNSGTSAAQDAKVFNLEKVGETDASSMDEDGIFTYEVDGLITNTEYKFTIKGASDTGIAANRLSAPYAPFISAHTPFSIGEAPAFDAQPSSYILTEPGKAVTISAHAKPAAGGGTILVKDQNLHIQWEQNTGTGWVSIDAGRNKSAQSFDLILGNFTEEMDGVMYRCKVTQSIGRNDVKGVVKFAENSVYSEVCTLTTDAELVERVKTARANALRQAPPKEVKTVEMENEITLSKEELADAGGLILKSVNGIFVIDTEELAAMVEKMSGSFTLKCESVETVEIEGLDKTVELKNKPFRIEAFLDGEEYVSQAIKFVTPYSGEDENSSEMSVLNVWNSSGADASEGMGIFGADYITAPINMPNGLLSEPQLYFSLHKNGIYILLNKEQSEAVKDVNDLEELKLRFKDFASHWAAEYLQALIDSGAFRDWAAQNMEPNDNITLGTLALLLKWYSGDTSASGGACDIMELDSYKIIEALKWAAEHELIFGSSSAGLNANEPLTKEQLVTIMDRLFIKKGISLPDLVPAEIMDMDSVSSWAYESVSRFAEAGIVIGDSQGYFNPGQMVTFGQFAAIVQNIKERLSQPVPLPEMPIDAPISSSDEDAALLDEEPAEGEESPESSEKANEETAPNEGAPAEGAPAESESAESSAGSAPAESSSAESASAESSSDGSSSDESSSVGSSSAESSSAGSSSAESSSAGSSSAESSSAGSSSAGSSSAESSSAGE